MSNIWGYIRPSELCRCTHHSRRRQVCLCSRVVCRRHLRARLIGECKDPFIFHYDRSRTLGPCDGWPVIHRRGVVGRSWPWLQALVMTASSLVHCQHWCSTPSAKAAVISADITQGGQIGLPAPSHAYHLRWAGRLIWCWGCVFNVSKTEMHVYENR